MANEVNIQKTIRLSKKRDVAIAQWAILIKNDWEGGISFLAKHAIRRYINGEDFACIGKIHLPKNDEAALSQQPSISLRFGGDAYDIVQWLEACQNRGIAASTMIREILRKSIQIIPDTEDEWLPNCLDFDSDILEVARKLNLAPPLRVASEVRPSVPEVHPVVKDVPQERNPVASMSKGADTAPTYRKKEPDISNRSDVQKKQPPRAAALCGKHFTG